MAKYKECKSYNLDCPCYLCHEQYRSKKICINQELEDGMEVNTELLCDKARAFCEKANGGQGQ